MKNEERTKIACNLSNSQQISKYTTNLHLCIVICIVCVFIAGNFYVMSSAHGFFQWVGAAYDFITINFPLILFLCGLLALLVSRRTNDVRYRWSPYILWACALLLVGLRIYATHIEPYRLQIREVSFVTDKVDRPISILHISDIQSQAVGAYEESVFERIAELKPDLILHTGDLLQPNPPVTWDSEIEKITPLIDSLSPPYGIYSIVGNTDGYREEQIANGVGKMRILEGTGAVVVIGKMRVNLWGLRLDESRMASQPLLDIEGYRDWLNGLDESDFSILMGHIPNYMLQVGESSIDLCLAGHTHGGQIRIPFLGPLTVLSAVPHSWGRGFRQAGSTHINVSAGIGSEHAHGIPSIRVFCPPEMTLFRLVPAENEG